MSRGPSKAGPAARRRSAARLAAVQALYQLEFGGTPETVLRDILQHGSDEAEGVASDESALVEPETDLLTSIVRGTLERQERLDGMIAGALSKDWPMERLEAVLRAVLRAGAFELSERPDVPPRVVISEYVDVAHAFYSGPEPGLVNAVLDRIARVVRAEEFGQ